MTRKAHAPADALSELELLSALMERLTSVAKRLNTTQSGLLKVIVNDQSLWAEMVRRRDFLQTGAEPEGGGKTRSISLEMRDRIRTGLDRRLSAGKPSKAA